MQSKIEYLRVITTNQCNLFCQGCHKEGQTTCKHLSLEDLEIYISSCIAVGIKKVKLMGGEPSLRKDVLVLIKNIKNKFPAIDLSMISNGTASIEFYDQCFKEGLDRLNISVHGWEKTYYIKNTSSTEQSWLLMRNNVKVLAETGKINKINYVLKKGVNEEDLWNLIDALSTYKVRLDILNYLDFAEDKSELYYSMEEIEQLLDKRFGIVSKGVYVNNYSINSVNVVLKNGLNINLKVNPLNAQQFLEACKTCAVKDKCIEGIKAVRLTADGKIQPCLIRQDNFIDLTVFSKNDLPNELEHYFVNL